MSNVIYVKQISVDETPAIVYNLPITESLNELSTVSFTLDDNVQNKAATLMMSPQTMVLVPETGQWFRLTTVNPISLGNTRSYQVAGVHVGTDLHDKYVEGRLSNTQSLDACMKYITDGTAFKYVIHDTFSNYSFSDGFGGDFADNLFMNTLKDDFGFEFYFDNWTIHIYKKIGQSDQFVFIDGYNAHKISWTEDYSNIRTKIKGLGKQNDDGSYAATAEYTSPNAYIWGVKQAATVQDDRFTDSNSLNNYIKGQLQDYPIIQYTMERAEFEHGAKLSDINSIKMGNSGLLKDRLGVDVDTRIVGMTYYPQDSKQTDTITFGNKIFDSAHNWAMQQRAKDTNEHIGKSVKQLSQDVTSMMNNGVWYIWS
nr:MAG TPA: tail protein [Caudoviricetes sp.]